MIEGFSQLQSHIFYVLAVNTHLVMTAIVLEKNSEIVSPDFMQRVSNFVQSAWAAVLPWLSLEISSS